MVDRHIVAEIVLFGMVLDVLGALYLAYDLLGGRKGPLRSLTEILTWTVGASTTGFIGLFTVLYIGQTLRLRILTVLGYSRTFSDALGFVVGGSLGLGVGYTFHVLFQQRKMRRNETIKDLSTKARVLYAAFVISPVFGLISAFAIAFDAVPDRDILTGFLVAFAIEFVGSVITGFIGRMLVARKVADTVSGKKPLVDMWAPILGVTAILPAGLIMGITYWITYGPNNIDGLIKSLLIGGGAGFIGGLGCGIGASISPRIEWAIGNLPPTRLGTFGAVLILFGFVIQSIQYWLVVFNISVR